MDILVVSLAAFIASGLTLFSGFGVGTLLMPVVAIFFPIEIAIAITAMVHFSNNLFKVALFGKHAKPSVLIRFGIPAVIFAFVGAFLLIWLSEIPSLFEYTAFGRNLEVSLIKVIIGILILSFVFLELWARFSALKLDKKYLSLGGIISGFFGGLSGHQGAFRSMFLLKAGLSKEQFIATGVMLAVLVDLSRMIVYGWEMSAQREGIDWQLVIAASVSAFSGSYLGRKLLRKLTIHSIQIMVSILLVIVSLGLILGVL